MPDIVLRQSLDPRLALQVLKLAGLAGVGAPSGPESVREVLDEEVRIREGKSMKDADDIKQFGSSISDEERDEALATLETEAQTQSDPAE